MANQRTFSDLDFSFTAHPTTGDILRVYDLNSAKAAVRHLVLTEFYGRPFHPEIGSSVAGLLFENWSPLLNKAIQATVTDIIKSSEPRAEVYEVRAEFDPNSYTYYIEVDLFFKALMQEVTIDFLLKKVR